MTYDNNACYVKHALLLNSAFLSTFVSRSYEKSVIYWK